MRKIRMGMIGGGIGAFIGEVHRIAARMDGHIELVCGAFSSSAERSKESGKMLYLPEDRSYSSYEEMIKTESQLPENIRMDFVSIVTPNHLHSLDRSSAASDVYKRQRLVINSSRK